MAGVEHLAIHHVQRNSREWLSLQNSLTDSYRDEMIKKADSFVKVTGADKHKNITAGHVGRATAAINKQRLSQIQNTPAYKTMSTNKRGKKYRSW